MNSLFYGCSSLSNISGISNWNTNNVINMGYMFYGCSSLTNISEISNWNTNNVTNMIGMFFGCNSLSYIPSKFKNAYCHIF